MYEEYHRYAYEGPVMEFGVCVSNNWKGETVAPSERKARVNLAYQFKKNTNRLSDTRITLPGKITMIY